MLFRQPTKKRQYSAINKAQHRKLTILLISIVNLVANSVNHKGTFWGISFPVNTFPFDETAIDMVEKDLEGRWPSLLKPRLQRLDLAAIIFAVVTEGDWKFIEHTFV
jgi:hypothetical protein